MTVSGATGTYVTNEAPGASAPLYGRPSGAAVASRIPADLAAPCRMHDLGRSPPSWSRPVRRLTVLALTTVVAFVACTKPADKPADTTAVDTTRVDSSVVAPVDSMPMVGAPAPVVGRGKARRDTANVIVACGKDAASTTVDVDVDTVKVKVGRRILWPVTATGGYDSIVVAPKDAKRWPFAGNRTFGGTDRVQSLPVKGPKGVDYAYQVTAFCGGPTGFTKVLDPDIYVD